MSFSFSYSILDDGIKHRAVTGAIAGKAYSDYMTIKYHDSHADRDEDKGAFLEILHFDNGQVWYWVMNKSRTDFKFFPDCAAYASRSQLNSGSNLYDFFSSLNRWNFVERRVTLSDRGIDITFGDQKVRFLESTEYYEDELDELLAFLLPKKNGGQRRGKTASKSKTSEKVVVGNRLQCVYMGPRGGRYYKSGGKFVSLVYS